MYPFPGLQPAWGDVVLLIEQQGVAYEELLGGIVSHARERQGS